MTAITTTRWTCETCSRNADTGPNQQPAGWARLVMTRPPLASPTEVNRGDTLVDAHVCGACVESVRNLLV